MGFRSAIFLFLFVGMLVACDAGNLQEEHPTEVSVDTEKLDSVIGVLQMTLVGKLTEAIEQKGLPAAAEFCSAHAQHLTDSLSGVLGYSIRRISDKNRNTKNALNSYDAEVMHAFRVSKEAGNLSSAQINTANRTYYKPILLGMPVCLKCHGTAQDRDSAAYEIIRSNYPNDLAVDYSLGDLRGMWVVKY
jgi:hypothetical protein